MYINVIVGILWMYRASLSYVKVSCNQKTSNAIGLNLRPKNVASTQTSLHEAAYVRSDLSIKRRRKPRHRLAKSQESTMSQRIEHKNIKYYEETWHRQEKQMEKLVESNYKGERGP